MKLKNYLHKENLTQHEFIKIIEDNSGKKIPQGTLAKWITGMRIPRKDEVKLIYEVTNKLVEPNDFYDIK